MAIQEPLNLDLSQPDTRTAVPLYNEMQTHRRTWRSQTLAEHLKEIPVDKIRLPACLPGRCRGIAYVGLQRIPVEQFGKDRCPLVLQTTLPILL